MPARPVYKQLVLIDDNGTRTTLFDNPENMADIPSNCDFCVFCNKSDSIVKQSINRMKNPQIQIYESTEPVNQMLDTLNENLIKYSLIIIICDEMITDRYKWNKNKEVKINTIIKRMNPSTTTVECILNEFHRHGREENLKKMISMDPRFFPIHQCPRCSETFHLNNDLRKHDENDHFSVIDDDLHHEYRAVIQYNSRRHPNDRYKDELYCVRCSIGFQTLEARVNHVNDVHPNAGENDDE